MTRFKYSDVVLVGFPFTDLRTTKKRPAVVISNSTYNDERSDLILIAISSQIRPPLLAGEALITNWEQAGLIKPSLFKPLIATIEKGRITRKLGELSTADRNALRGVLRSILSYSDAEV